MFGNPYDQGVWTNQHTSNYPLLDQRVSPTYGALPHHIPVLSPNIITFVFSSTDQDFLNCDVTDTSFRKSYKITTNKRGLGNTTIRRADGETSSMIDWQRHPEVEVSRSIRKQRASSLLRLTPGGKGRFMDIKGQQYIWKNSSEVISLYTLGNDKAGEPLAKITRTARGILLEITTAAVQTGLLDVAVTVTVLLHSGRRFD
ncbi:hypothetical protein AGABI2DRAFT_179422 [Agaricus bisporus var. bisporus H97]|uniref:hypothetical protein n=1 Tax=Agaricus bisporus var. bisporus (strain H97 / ATCC MYA-4626 / FGSC 10389) TaxID=936046 RepID=UPI00029F5EB6|nr:hypothetical protein AGABI2DRAFT_179422 [Agaricus bisporus var. bisporus H97]EKV45986.1 hypothetical protein AGABI2DRAFT_179422 [Agaricus bisporus var. bisporus H97]